LFAVPAVSLPIAFLFAQPSGEQLPPGQYKIGYENGLVTIKANEANVPQLLEDFSKASGITFNKYLGSSPKVSLDLHKARVDDFLHKVLGSYVAKSKKKDGVEIIYSVTVMDEEADSPPPPPPDAKKPAHSRRERRRRPFRRYTPGAPRHGRPGSPSDPPIPAGAPVPEQAPQDPPSSDDRQPTGEGQRDNQAP